MITYWCLVVAEQCLHQLMDFPAPHTALPASRLGVHKELGRDTTMTADPNWPRGYPTPYGITLNNKKRGSQPGRDNRTAWGQAGHWSVSRKQLHCASLALCVLLLFHFPFLSTGVYKQLLLLSKIPREFLPFQPGDRPRV